MHRVSRCPGEQLIQSCRRPTIDELREHVSKPVLGTNAIEAGAILSAASCLTWIARLFGASEAELLEPLGLRPKAPSPLNFLPYLSVERTPHGDPQARGMLEGLSHGNDRAAIVQAALEGVAFALADCRDALADTGVVISEADAINGGSRSRFWLSVLASVSGNSDSSVRQRSARPDWGVCTPHVAASMQRVGIEPLCTRRHRSMFRRRGSGLAGTAGSTKAHLEPLSLMKSKNNILYRKRAITTTSGLCQGKRPPKPGSSRRSRGSDARTGRGDFGDRDSLNRAGSGSEVRSGLSDLPACVRPGGQLLRVPLRLAASVRRVRIGSRRAVRDQSIFRWRGRACGISAASPRPLIFPLPLPHLGGWKWALRSRGWYKLQLSQASMGIASAVAPF
jgi:hypothetical protein